MRWEGWEISQFNCQLQARGFVTEFLSDSLQVRHNFATIRLVSRFSIKCIDKYSGARLSTLVLHQWSIKDLCCRLLEFSSHFHLFSSSRPSWTRLNFEWKVTIFKTIKSLVNFHLTHSVFFISFLEHYNRFHRSFLK